jgi:hypothetical protein
MKTEIRFRDVNGNITRGYVLDAKEPTYHELDGLVETALVVGATAGILLVLKYAVVTLILI